jgi:hypothetical protein
MDEPWRGRFLTLLADQATGGTWGEEPPGHEQVAAWLDDPALFSMIGQMLDAWLASREG